MAENTFPGAAAAPEGMLYKGVLCRPIVENCKGCDRVRGFEDQEYCSSYPAPAGKWSMGRCNFATHVKKESKSQAKVNPLKASKRASKGK
ncbi:MAG: PxxKW family cysteine-rich protein [Desulfovibrionaceae bacterium]|nr:PxxKW family cysteine-rich protein [Desulfovibrionaceae bacterium]